jgi:murein DD-endopeptidase MepM/ murein hydrolase activator NlpD
MVNDPRAPTVDDTATALSAGLSRIAVGQVATGNGDLNTGPPPLTYDPVTKQAYYTTAPVPIKRLFGSPLTLQGPNMRGAVRGVDFGWTANHRALDYPVVVGEPVLAMGDGSVVFAGFQSKSVGLLNVEYARADAVGNILTRDGDMLRSVSDVGAGGICLFILHNGDFEGYRTEYYNLGSIDVSAVSPANRVIEGQAIGKTGGTGGPSGFRRTQQILSLQISFVSGTITTLVPPTSIAPNAWPGHRDSTSGAGQHNRRKIGADLHAVRRRRHHRRIV